MAFRASQTLPNPPSPNGLSGGQTGGLNHASPVVTLSHLAWLVISISTRSKCDNRIGRVRSSRLEVRSSVFTISLPNTTRLLRLPRGGLGALWINSDTPWYHRTP